jgi:hypothetical protein
MAKRQLLFGDELHVHLLPLLVSPERVEERKVRWGVTSPIYQFEGLGRIPRHL